MSGDRGEWDYTRRYESALSGRRELEEREYGGVKEKYYLGRRMIVRDTPINGGVYVCMDEKGQVEAVVVDDKKEKMFDVVYRKLLKRREETMRRTRDTFKSGLLNDVFEFVREEMPYNREESDRLVAEDVKIGRKVTLAAFIAGKAGVCRHQALLTAYLLERLQREGKINPRSISIDRNFLNDGRGHCWVRYTNSFGMVFIIDPAMGFVGRLDDPKRQGWPYERPEDEKKVR